MADNRNDVRQARLALALRENLRRRKAQSRGWAAGNSRPLAEPAPKEGETEDEAADGSRQP